MLWAEAGDVDVTLAAVDAMAAPDVTDMVGADMKMAADTGAVAMTVVDVVTTSKAQPPSHLKTALNKTQLTA